jgi:hypothetical protein
MLQNELSLAEVEEENMREVDDAEQTLLKEKEAMLEEDLHQVSSDIKLQTNQYEKELEEFKFMVNGRLKIQTGNWLETALQHKTNKQRLLALNSLKARVIPRIHHGLKCSVAKDDDVDLDEESCSALQPPGYKVYEDAACAKWVLRGPLEFCRSRSWRKAGSALKALHMLSRKSWSEWLPTVGLECLDCPVQGLFTTRTGYQQEDELNLLQHCQVIL